MADNYRYPSMPGTPMPGYPVNSSPLVDGEATGLQKTVLYGREIQKCPIPLATAKPENKPMVVFPGVRGAFGMNQELLSKHLLLLGGIGSGKTNAAYFIVKALMEKIAADDLVLIFDSKGDFHKRFFNGWNPNHIVVGNHEAYAGSSYCWNIFDELRNANGRFDRASELAAKEISKSLFVGRESQSQPFFSQAATDVVAKVLIDFFRHRPERDLHNAELVRFFSNANVDAYHSMIDRNPDFESARDYFGKRGATLTAQALGVMSYVTTMVNDVFVGIFGEHRSRSFSMRKLVREKGAKVVFIEYDLNTGEMLGPIYGLLYDLALKEAMGGRSHRGSTYLVCDEFRILPKLNHINDALNLGRSLGVKVIAGLQTINQLYDVYGEERGKTLAAGFMNSFCFQTFDLDTRKFVTERFGENYINLSFHSLVAPVHSQRAGHTVEDWDVLGLRVGEAFVNLSGHTPFRFYFKEYM